MWAMISFHMVGADQNASDAWRGPPMAQLRTSDAVSQPWDDRRFGVKFDGQTKRLNVAHEGLVKVSLNSANANRQLVRPGGAYGTQPRRENRTTGVGQRRE
jgi:hypothetical protein